MKKYILKEYGSWSVALMAYLVGIFAGGSFNIRSVALLVSIAIFINSKQAFTLWMRGIETKLSSKIFIGQIFSATLIFLSSVGEGIIKFLPYISIPIAYLMLLYFKGEHALITELFGFGLLTISSLIAKFSAYGTIDITLYLTVFIFFGASIFKVKLYLKKGLAQRVSMLCYLAVSTLIYHFMKMPLILLLPLIDNLIFSLKPYSARLKVMGWIEVSKGILFLMLISALS